MLDMMMICPMCVCGRIIYISISMHHRYAKSPSLYAVELLNEPLSPGVTLERLNKYYKAGYEAVRKHSSTAYVVLSNRLGPSEPKELFPLASGFMRSVIDVHYYNIFDDLFENMTAQQNIDFIYTNRSSELNFITTSNGPLTFVGNDPLFSLLLIWFDFNQHST